MHLREIVSAAICLLATSESYAEVQSRVYGQVTDTMGIPVSGAVVTVSADGSQAVLTTTDENGRYGLELGGAAKSRVDLAVPGSSYLSQSFPNPFNPTTQIPYRLGEATRVRLVVYNTVGQAVRTLVDQDQAAGDYVVKWDGRDDAGTGVAAGVYIARMATDSHVQSRKMVLTDGSQAHGGGAPPAWREVAREGPRVLEVTVTGSRISPIGRSEIMTGDQVRLDFQVERLPPAPSAKVAVSSCVPGKITPEGIVLGLVGGECLIMEAFDRTECRAGSNYKHCQPWVGAASMCAGDWRLPDKAESLLIWEQRGGGSPESSNGLCVEDGATCASASAGVPHAYWTSTQYSGDEYIVMDRGAITALDESVRSSVRCVQDLPYAPPPPTITETEKLLPDPFSANAHFGQASALSGDGTHLVVGAHGDAKQGIAAGAAYPYLWTGQDWTQLDKLLPADGGQGQKFGWSVSVSHDGLQLAVGAPYATNDQGVPTGAVYLFHNVGGHWTESQKVTPSTGVALEQFGTSVAFSGDGGHLAVGSLGESSVVSNSGAAYLFVADAGIWSQRALLKADDPEKYVRFGVSVALDGAGTTVLVGAPGTDQAGQDAGSAYVFESNHQGEWNQAQKLAAFDAVSHNRFGSGVGVAGEGNTLVVGAGASAAAPGPGGAYLFYRSGGQWTVGDKLTAHDEQDGAVFGHAVAISYDGNTVIAGAPRHDTGSGSGGKVYRFLRAGGAWEQTFLTPTDAAAADEFGQAVSLASEATIVGVGAHQDDDRGLSSGSTYVFGTPTPDADLPASIEDLVAVRSIDDFSVTLTWTAEGDDGASGRAAGYEIRYGTSTIATDAECGAAALFSNEITPGQSGSPEAITVADLERDTSYEFCVRAIDDAGNRGQWAGPAVDAATLPFLLRLPFPQGDSYAILQGHGGSVSHNDGCDNQFGLDFDMDRGSIITAAASGRVVAAIESYRNDIDSGCGISYADQGNRIVIDHGSGLHSVYLHLQEQGALVNAGDLVRAGDPIGLSGNTGWVCPDDDDPTDRGDHLHFAVHSWDGGLCSESFPFSDSGLPQDGVPQKDDVVVSQNDGSTDLLSAYEASVSHPTSFFQGGRSLVELFPSTEIELFVPPNHLFRLQGRSESSVASQVVVFLFRPGESAVHWTAYDVDEDGNFDINFTFPTNLLGAFNLAVATRNPWGNFYTDASIPIHVD